MKSRICFLLFVIAAMALAAIPMLHLAVLAFTNDQYSHIVVVPLVSGCLLYARRKEYHSLTDNSSSARLIAVLIAASAVLVRAIAWIDRAVLSVNDALSLAALSFVLLFAA